MKNITKATLHNYKYSKTIELNYEQIGQLNELMKNGLALAEAEKRVYLRTIVFSYDGQKKENEISLYKYGFIKFNKKYYVVKDSHKNIFNAFVEAAK